MEINEEGRRVHTAETKAKISETLKGKKMTEEPTAGAFVVDTEEDPTEAARIKRSAGMMGEKNPMFGKFGKDNPRYGMKHSEETKEKIRSTLRRRHQEKTEA